MLVHIGIAVLCVVVGVALGLAYVRLIKGSLRQKWPKANPGTWKDED